MGTGRIFISYRRDDSRADSGRIYDHLSARFPGKVFRDVGSLEPGIPWRQAIGRVLSQSDACVVVIGNHWLNITGEDGKRRLDDPNDTVRQEIFAALQRQIRVFPVLVGGAKMPKAQDLPVDLQPLCARHALEITEQGWSECCGKLLRALEVALGVPPLQIAVEKKSSAPKFVAALALAAIVIIVLLAYVGGRPRPELSPQPNPAYQNPAPSPPRLTQPPNLTGNWIAHAIINGIPYSSTIELDADHSFRTILNGVTIAVGTWQSDAPEELNLTDGTDLNTGIHFSCHSGSSANGFRGTCSNRLGYTWNLSMTRQ